MGVRNDQVDIDLVDAGSGGDEGGEATSEATSAGHGDTSTGVFTASKTSSASAS